MIDGDGIIRWSYVSPVGVNPGADGILDGAGRASAKEAGDVMTEQRPRS